MIHQLRSASALALAALLVLPAGCTGDDQPEQASSLPPEPQQVDLTYSVPAGMTEVAMPSPSAGTPTKFVIKLYQGGDGCQLRIVRLLLPKGDGTEDQDATYNMLGAIMRESGVTSFSTNGLMVPGTPGPVPTLVVAGQNSSAAMRAAGRVSNTSLQGYQVVYGCPKDKLAEPTWDALVKSLKVDGYTGSLDMH